MMVEVTVRRIGNSLGVILPAEATMALKVHEGDKLFLTESPDGVRLTPYDPEFAKQLEAAEQVMHEDRDVLRQLAE